MEKFLFFNNHLGHIYACLAGNKDYLGDITPYNKILKIIDFLAVKDNFGTIGPVVPYFTEFFYGDFHVQHKKHIKIDPCRYKL